MNRMNFPRQAAVAIAGLVAVLAFPAALRAQTFTPVLDLPVSYPQIVFDGSSASRILYDASTKLLKVDASSVQVTYSPGGGGFYITNDAVTTFGTFTVRALVDNVANNHGTLGKLVGGIAPGDPNDACGSANGDEFCIVGRTTASDGTSVSGILLRGEVVDFAAMDSTHVLFSGVDTIVDDFEFHIRLTGGLLKPNYPSGFLVVWTHGLHDPFERLPEFSGTFAANFGDVADGITGATDPYVAPLPPCTGQIGDFVWDDLNHNGIQDPGEPGLLGASVTLNGASLSAPVSGTTDADGHYSFGPLCAGTYVVQASTPQWYASSPIAQGTNRAIDSSDSPVTVILARDDSKDLTTDFGFYFTAAVSNAYTTFAQGGWGAKPRGNNPGKWLADWFTFLYPDPDLGVVIGLSGPAFSISLTNAAVIQDFLPQGGKPAALTQDYVDPIGLLRPRNLAKHKTHNKIGEFAGNVLALRLNVDFSNASLTRFGFGSLHVVSGALTGQTVNQVLAIANTALSGGALPAGLTLTGLNEIIEKINLNYEAGTKDKHYLM